MINEENDLNKLRKVKNLVLIRAQDDSFNRKALEQLSFKGIVDLESGNRQDTIRNINSGSNQVITDIAKKKKITICFDLKSLRMLSLKQQANRIKKIIETIKHVRKSKGKLGLVNCKDEKNARALLRKLGASSEQASQAVTF